MSMDYASNTGHCISYEDLRLLCPQYVAAVENHPDFRSWEECAMASYDDEEQLDGTVSALCEEFKRVTETEGRSLELCLTHYDSESGSKYDEPHDHEGCIFEALEVMEMTPAGKRFDHIIKPMRFVTFG